jgi:outer membrane protein assembly factor BamB
MTVGRSFLLARAALFSALVFLSTAAWAQTTVGWRGNWSGRWPEASPPLTWHRLPRGALEDLRSSAAPPQLGAEQPVESARDGFVRTWLVAGPFPVADSEAEFDQQQLAGEADLAPAAGDAAGSGAWQPLAMQEIDRYALGPAELPWVDPGSQLGYAKNQVAYAFTWVHCTRPGRAQGVVDHGHGLKVWVNGQEVYRHAERGMALTYYTSLSRQRYDLQHYRSPKFSLELRQGWNRLLCKLSSDNVDGFTDMRFSLRLIDPPDVPYDEQNIAWMTPLPESSTGTPIVVGDRIFLMAEPSELICLDKHTGRILWSADNGYYEALTDEERAAQPVLSDEVAPRVAAIRTETDPLRRLELRRQVQELLVGLDREKFEPQGDGHFISHFGIVGFTTPTPASDGKHVYVWCGNGVAACYDLDGQRQWIARLDTGELSYPSSPALIGDRFVVFMQRLYGLDAHTGEVAWRQPRVNKNTAAVQPATIAGVEVIVTQQGEVVRASDGQMLYRNPNKVSSDSGWAAPTILGDVVYLPWYGISRIDVLDFSACTGDDWQEQVAGTSIEEVSIPKHPSGGWLDRWMAGSLLWHDGLLYGIDIYSTAYGIDATARTTLWREELPILGLFHYNAVPVAASPVLAGGAIYFLDNQGGTIVAEPGREFRQLAHNRLATQLDRDIPIPAQEVTSYAPPIADGPRLYIRGERYLYCIAEPAAQP